MLGLPAFLCARPSSAPPLLIVGPTEARDWLAALAPRQGWRYEFVLLQQFAGSWQEQQQWQGRPQQHSHQQQQQQQHPQQNQQQQQGKGQQWQQYNQPGHQHRNSQQHEGRGRQQEQQEVGDGVAALMCNGLGFSRWCSVAVDHCHGAFGLVLEHSQVGAYIGWAGQGWRRGQGGVGFSGAGALPVAFIQEGKRVGGASGIRVR